MPAKLTSKCRVRKFSTYIREELVRPLDCVLYECVRARGDGRRHLCFWLRFRVQLLPHFTSLQSKLLRSDLWLVTGGQKPNTCPVLRAGVNTGKDTGKHALCYSNTPCGTFQKIKTYLKLLDLAWIVGKMNMVEWH